MFCSCRTAPLRLFVRSLAQLHLSEQPAARPVAHFPLALRPLPARREAFSTTSRIRDAEKMSDGVSEAAAETHESLPSTAKASDTPDYIRPESTKSPRREIYSSGTKSSPKMRSRARSTPPASEHKATPLPSTREGWQIQKAALKEKFPDGWRPMKRLSPDAVAGIRALHAQFPQEYTTPQLAKQFEVSAEAIRRILKSKWEPSPEEEEDRQERWFRRGKSVWSRYAELGMKPPQKWRREGVVRDPTWHEKRQAAISRRKQEEETRGAGARLHRKLGGGIM